jgi:two-component system LytT family response regulator/two-component system response regulator LytT/LytT family two-component system response regulator NatR
MNIRTLILDDDIHSTVAACAALADYPEIEVVGRFSNSKELLTFLEAEPAHLLFLDIELEQEMGFSVAQRLRQLYPELMVVFLTGHSSYAIDGYDFQPVNFLTKPINPLKLEQTIAEVQRRLSQQGQAAAQLMFHLQHGYRILDVRDICYIERDYRKNFLHLESESLRIAGYTMRELENMLSAHGFFLCHQSFLISLYRVTAVQDIGRQLYEVQLRGVDKPIPVSRTHYDELLRRLHDIGIQDF